TAGDDGGFVFFAEQFEKGFRITAMREARETTVPAGGRKHSRSQRESRNESSKARLAASSARERSRNCSRWSRAITERRSAGCAAVAENKSLRSHMRRASSGAARIQPQRRPLRPYTFVRLLVTIKGFSFAGAIPF